MATVREFTTQWQGAPKAWHEWDQEALLHSMVVGGRGMPVVRAFDYFVGRSVGMLGTVTLYEAPRLRIVAQNPLGPDPYYMRFADADVIYFQFSGTSQIKTEHGVWQLSPGETVRVPSGVAQRTVGSPECRRIAIFSRAFIDYKLSAADYHTHREFTVASSGGVVQEPISAVSEEECLEAMWRWSDPVWRPMWRMRNETEMATGTTGREVTILRAFDFFREMSGQEHGGPGPVLFENRETKVEVYNLEGAQFAFHRGFGVDELWFQFRGTSWNESEYGVVELNPGEMTIVPPGVSHRAVGGQGFLRFNIYHEDEMELRVDPRQQLTQTRYDIQARTIAD